MCAVAGVEQEEVIDNELILFDRLEVIKSTIAKYGEENFYLSFSGGKDSTVVHHLLDLALPENKIPRVFSNTGIEYNAVVEFVKDMAKSDDRFVFIYPKQNIKQMLERVGYPFKSKEHSTRLGCWQNGSRSKSVMRYITETEGKYCCPEILRYQFTDQFKLKVSPYCCHELKKKPMHRYEQESGKNIAMTGMMREEGGQREHMDCIVTKKGKVIKFHPLAKVTKEWEEWFIQEHNVKLCKLYYEPFNFYRTGCKGCPLSLSLSQQLETMERYMPNERKQTEMIWQPVYDEYRRIGYRLQSEEQTKLF